MSGHLQAFGFQPKYGHIPADYLAPCKLSFLLELPDEGPMAKRE